jgi:beta-glucuronidase
VPGDWNSQRPELFFYEGLVWYRNAFEKPEHGERFFLRFGAVNRRATVWLNGAELGSHEVGFTPFAFEVTDRLVEGENVVMVRVDNRRRGDDVPGLLTDWWNYGGITREVSVLGTPEIFVRDWSVGLSADGSAIEGWVRVDGAGAGERVTVGIPGAGLSISAATDASGIARFRGSPAGVERWSPGSPRLYDITLSAGGDRVTDRVGFRTIGAEGGDILLNGERVFLRGISIHEEAPGGGRAWSEAHARTLLGWAKELNCNYVRLAHYPHNGHMLRVADELGLMVWAEIPVYWVIDYENPRTLRLAETHMREMIERDKNRASVVIWSVGNETGDDPERTAFRVALGEKVKAWDPTRLLSAACFMRTTRDADGAITEMHVDDPFGEVADVLAVNEYVGWYHDEPEDLSRPGHERGVDVVLGWDKPFVVSEFGAGVKQGYRAAAETRWSEAYGVRLYAHTLNWLEGVEELDGVSPWILKDFRSPRRPLYGVQDWYNRKGLISSGGVRKDVFRVLSERYERWGHEPPGE